MKKVIAALCALILLSACLTACSKRGANGYYVCFSSDEAARGALKYRPAEGTFDRILGYDRAAVYKIEDETKLYGVARIETGEIIVPIHYSNITESGDFYLCEGTLSDASLFNVYYKDGKLVYGSDRTLSIQDIGSGLVKVVEGSLSTVFNKKGTDILFGSNFDKDYDYVGCDNFILAKSSKSPSYLIFSAYTGECLRTVVYGKDDNVQVNYAGGNEFIVIYNAYLSETGNYRAKIEAEGDISYYDQKVFRITIGIEGMREIKLDRFIHKLHNRYDFGLSSEDRERYPLLDGYFAESDYELSGKTATGVIEYVLSDSNLRMVKKMPKDVSSLMKNTDGFSLGVSADLLYLFDGKLNVAASLPNEGYQSIKWSNGIIVAAKSTEGKVLYGAFTSSGTSVLPFEFTFLSPFTSGKAIGVKEGKTYIVSQTGEMRYCTDDTFPYFWDGFALNKEKGKIGIIDLNGDLLIPVGYDSVEEVSRFGDIVYLILNIGDLSDLFILS